MKKTFFSICPVDPDYTEEVGELREVLHASKSAGDIYKDWIEDPRREEVRYYIPQMYLPFVAQQCLEFGGVKIEEFGEITLPDDGKISGDAMRLEIARRSKVYSQLGHLALCTLLYYEVKPVEVKDPRGFVKYEIPLEYGKGTIRYFPDLHQYSNSDCYLLCVPHLSMTRNSVLLFAWGPDPRNPEQDNPFIGRLRFIMPAKAFYEIPEGRFAVAPYFEHYKA